MYKRILQIRFLFALLATGLSASPAFCADTDILRIAFLSCISSAAEANWKVIEDSESDIVIFLGDNVYFPSLEPISEAQMQKAYQQLADQPGFISLRQKKKIYAIWDDHDFGANNSDSSSPSSAYSKALFRKFWNNPAPPPELSDSIAFRVKLDFVTLLFTDNRSFRRNPAPGVPEALFGETQLRWLESELKNPETPEVILISGGQLLSEGENHENLAEYPAEQRRLFTAFESSPARVTILSGDRHFAEILARNFGQHQVLELTSSPFASRLAPASIPSQHNYRRSILIGRQNFGILTLQQGSKSIEHRVSINDPFGRPLISDYF